MDHISELTHLNFLTVNHKQKIRIPTYNIVMMEGNNKYTLFHLQNGKKKMYARTLRHFEEQMTDESFIRCHRAFLVNPAFIIGYDKEASKLHMVNNLKASISRRKHGRLGCFFLDNPFVIE